MNRIRLLFLGFIAICLLSCEKGEEPDPVVFPGLMVTPPGFPPMDFPDDNGFTMERWELGKKLFFDTALSRDSSISCASCHLPSLGFSDEVAFSPGVENRPGTRNSPSLSNVGYHPYFTREGGVPTLEMQVLVPIQEHNEFDFNIVLLADRIKSDPEYTQMSQLAYGRQPDPYVITRALANFERSLVSGNSTFDKFFYQDNSTALNAQERKGMDLFFSDRTNCFQCHGGFNFTNYAFENNGLYEDYEDPGRFRLTLEPEDRALFKIPSLRNIAVTGPYMHDGSKKTLAEVVDHYDIGGFNHPHKSSFIKPLGLTEDEKEALIAFLESLTDPSFLENPIFK